MRAMLVHSIIQATTYSKNELALCQINHDKALTARLG